jgi:hypothetical protein
MSRSQSSFGTERASDVKPARAVFGYEQTEKSVMKISHVLIALISVAFTCAAQLPNAAAQPAAEVGQMQARMQEMQALRERVRNTSDPAERQRLMDEHMRAMHDGVAMMGRMMGEQGGPVRAGECRQNDNECRMRQMQGEQRMMGERMSMMQMMMQQMMDQMMMRGSEGDDGATTRERRQDRADRQPREETKGRETPR